MRTLLLALVSAGSMACAGITTSPGDGGVPIDGGAPVDGRAAGSSACQSAGGTCVSGGCATTAPSSAQDCDTSGGGLFCCLALGHGSPPASEEAGAGGLTCAELTAEAESAINAAVSQAQAEDGNCTEDSDCASLGPGTECTGGCIDAVFNKAGVATLTTAIEQIFSRICASVWESGACQPVPPSGCPTTVDVPKCVSGTCRLVSPDGGD